LKLTLYLTLNLTVVDNPSIALDRGFEEELIEIEEIFKEKKLSPKQTGSYLWAQRQNDPHIIKHYKHNRKPVEQDIINM